MEGIRTKPYRDVGGVPTACVGETQGIVMGDVYTKAQCFDMLEKRVDGDYGPAVDACVHHELPPNRKAAYTSIAYNVGPAAFCASDIARLENAGDPLAACNAIVGYHEKAKVNGVLTYFPGLHNRRVKERALCLTAEPPALPAPPRG